MHIKQAKKKNCILISQEKYDHKKSFILFYLIHVPMNQYLLWRRELRNRACEPVFW